MNKRIKEIRKMLDMTQAEFSSKIGLSRNFIAQIETGAKMPSDRTISDICREFNINKDWLLTGNGEPTIEACQEERYSINIGKLQRADNETIMRWVNAIAETKPEVLVEIEKFMRKILEIEEGAVKKVL